MLVFGMPHERQVCVQDESEKTRRHSEYLACHSERSEEPLKRSFDHTKEDVRCMIVRTSRFRYNFPQSTTVRSLVVCATRDDRLIRRDSG
jgi:hypothetical protein